GGGGGGSPGNGRGGGGYPGNRGGGGRYEGGGYCRYNCCGGYSSGSCKRCCSYAGEPIDVQTEGNTHN
ncbi:hypothetical protein A2U01_0069920, partial [Trifolium medium]|nr:hypothetical protein [Trifolium medium]